VLGNWIVAAFWQRKVRALKDTVPVNGWRG